MTPQWEVFKNNAKELYWVLSYRRSHDLGEGWFIEDGSDYQFYSLSGDASETPEMAITKAIENIKLEVKP